MTPKYTYKINGKLVATDSMPTPALVEAVCVDNETAEAWEHTSVESGKTYKTWRLAFLDRNTDLADEMEAASKVTITGIWRNDL